MDYNTTRKPLLLPEYGRHIHKMVEYAMTIEDREERTRCAHAIIGVMGNLFPHLRDVNDFKHKLWDHLAIMSDFKLDIDFPYKLPEANSFSTKPEKVPYNDNVMRFRHYGRLVEQMIAEASKMEEGELKDHLIALIANNMRKSLVNWNRDHATDERLRNDIHTLSGGRLNPSIKVIKALEGRDSYNQHSRRRHYQRRNRE